jgi:hypothetical protein
VGEKLHAVRTTEGNKKEKGSVGPPLVGGSRAPYFRSLSLDNRRQSAVILGLRGRGHSQPGLSLLYSISKL